ncbi:hypothetical protein D3C81_2274960 [compost metagenome]
MTDQDEQVEWFSQGFAAYQRGEPYEAGPDQASQPQQAKDWQLGWMTGRAEAKGSPFDLRDSP